MTQKESMKTTRPKTSMIFFGMVGVVFCCAHYAHSMHSIIFAVKILNAHVTTKHLNKGNYFVRQLSIELTNY